MKRRSMESQPHPIKRRYTPSQHLELPKPCIPENTRYLGYEIASLARDVEPIKRHVVAIVGKFYDPMGFLSPTVIQFKMFFQQLCQSKLAWDQPLTGELLNKW